MRPAKGKSLAVAAGRGDVGPEVLHRLLPEAEKAAPLLIHLRAGITVVPPVLAAYAVGLIDYRPNCII